MIKVAQVIGRLDRGGIETWLKDVVLNYDKEKYKIDFIIMNPGKGVYDDIVTKKGSKLNEVAVRRGVFRFSANLYKTFKREKFDVVHAHPHYFCGVICFIAYLAGIPIRISHSHNDTSNSYAKSTLLRKCYLKFQRFLINKFSNVKIACSIEAGRALFGNRSFDVLYCGVDFSNFIKQEKSMRQDILEELKLPKDAYYIGHVGRFHIQKNHSFIIDVFNEVCKKESNSYLLLIGEGALEDNIREKVRTLGLSDKVIFLGGRDDVNVFTRDVFDAFIFPSLYEGLGIVLLEAQSSGIKCLISDVIPKEVILIRENIKSLSLNESYSTWANSLIDILHSSDNISNDEVVNAVNNSLFSIVHSVNELEKLYSNGGNT